MNKKLFIIPLIFLLTIFLVNAYDVANLKAYYGFDNSTSNLYNITDYSGIDTLKTNNIIYRSWKSGISNSGLYTAQNSVMSVSFGNLRTNNYFYKTDTTNYNSLTIISWNYWIKAESNTTFNPNSIISVLGLLSSNNVSFLIEYPNIKTDYAWATADYHNLYCLSRATTTNLCTYFRTEPPRINTTNTWNMVTVTYDLTTLRYYVNGNLIATKVTTTPIPTTNNLLALLYPFNSTIDELSIWDSVLTTADITNLYNGGAGLSYNQTLGITTTLPPQCLSPNTYCTSPRIYGNGEIGCNSTLQTEYCAQGCINNICYNNYPNGCNVEGYTRCEDSTSYSICDITPNGNLDYTSITNCVAGTYCRQNNYIAICQSLNTTKVHDNYGMVITPYSISNQNTTYTINSATQTVDVQTVYAVHTQDFIQDGTEFFSRACDYKETPVNTPIQFTIINESKTFTFDSAIGENAIIRMNFIPQDIDNGTINLLSQTGTSLSYLKYSHNASDKRMCFYESNNEIIYCDYDYGLSDSLSSIDLEYTFDMNSKTYTIKFVFNRDNTAIKNTYPRSYSQTNIAKLIFNATNTSLVSVTQFTIPVFRSFSSNNVFDSYSTMCAFLSTGNRLVRTYGNNDGTPDYSVYKDYNVNIIRLGATTQELARGSTESNFLNPDRYTTGSRYLIVLISCMVIICVFVGIGFAVNSAKGGFITGIVISAFTLIMFTVFKWIPSWIVVMLIIIAIAVSIFIGRSNNSTG